MGALIKKIPRTVWVLLGLAAAIYAAWSIAYPSGAWRYRMTVVIETPEGIKTGSAVREVFAAQGIKLTPESHAVIHARGEAVIVDLGNRGVLFALMRNVSGPDYSHQIVFNNFSPPHGVAPLSADGIRYYHSLKKGKATLSSDQYPTFVRFRDPKDSKTVENVIEMENNGGGGYRIKADHMEEMFGAGVRLKEVTIEMTDEPVTHGIEKYPLPASERGLYAVPHQLISLDDFQKGD